MTYVDGVSVKRELRFRAWVTDALASLETSEANDPLAVEEVVPVVGAEQVPGADVGEGPGVGQGAVGGQGAGDQVPLRYLPGGGGFRPSAAVLTMPKKFYFTL